MHMANRCQNTAAGQNTATNEQARNDTQGLSALLDEGIKRISEFEVADPGPVNSLKPAAGKLRPPLGAPVEYSLPLLDQPPCVPHAVNGGNCAG